MFERTKKAQEVLDEFLLQSIPTDTDGNIDVNELRKVTFKVQQASVGVTNRHSEDFKNHVDQNASKFKTLTSVGVMVVFTFAMVVLGLHWGWDWVLGAGTGTGVLTGLGKLFRII